MTGPETRKRAASREASLRRQATPLILPLGRQIAKWNVQASFIDARVRNSRTSFAAAAAARAKAAELERSISGEMRALEAQLDPYPQEVRSSSRVVDTFRALRSVLDRLRASIGEGRQT